MNVEEILHELRQQANHIANAISALVGGQHAGHRGPGRPAGSKNAKTVTKRKRRTLSASARARISAAQKARWAEQKGKSAAKKASTTGEKTAVRRPMSAAARKKLSAMMKARWAATKKAA